MGVELFEQFGEAGEDGFFLFEQGEEAVPFTGDEVIFSYTGAVEGHEIAPDRFIGSSVVGGEVEAVGVTESEFSEDIEEGLFVERFAIYDHAIHIEDDGFGVVHGMDLRPASFSSVLLSALETGETESLD